MASAHTGFSQSLQKRQGGLPQSSSLHLGCLFPFAALDKASGTWINLPQPQTHPSSCHMVYKAMEQSMRLFSLTAKAQITATWCRHSWTTGTFTNGSAKCHYPHCRMLTELYQCQNTELLDWMPELRFNSSLGYFNNTLYLIRLNIRNSCGQLTVTSTSL